jgi:glycosyltransferase involved in cell wall biosynthesis
MARDEPKVTKVKPRLTLHMMVLNGASVIERALRPLRGSGQRPIVDEIVFTDTGSVDDTVPMLSRLTAELGCPCKMFLQSPMLQPEDYILDEPTSFKMSFPGEFSGGYLLRDWAAARNRSLRLATGQYVMKLDADDEVLRPDHILQTLDYLDTRPDIDVVMSPYETMAGTPPATLHVSMYTRLWRRRDQICFREVCHENVDHYRAADGSNWLMTPGLPVRDWRDSIGAGVRPQHRNFKVLLVEYERLAALGQPPNKHLLLYLSDEASSFLPSFALKLLGQISDASPVDKMWMHLIAGQSLTRKGLLRKAEREYEKAAALDSPRGALLLAMLRAVRRSRDWRNGLQLALDNSQKKLWPFGASHAEVETARSLAAKTDC